MRSAEYPWVAQYTLDSWNQRFDAAFKIARENPELAAVVDQLRPFLSTNSNAFFFVFDQNAVDAMLDTETGYMRDMSNPADGKIASEFTPATRSSDLDLSRHIITPMITDSLDPWMAKYTEAEAKLRPDPNDWNPGTYWGKPLYIQQYEPIGPYIEDAPFDPVPCLLLNFAFYEWIPTIAIAKPVTGAAVDTTPYGTVVCSWD